MDVTLVDYAEELVASGIIPIPCRKMDKVIKPLVHVSEVRGISDFESYRAAFDDADSIAVKLCNDVCMLDFDLKNGGSKEMFEEWRSAVSHGTDGVIDKVCIETTRNGGYHVYFRHHNPLKKEMLARSKSGAELIALYSGDVLSYTDPTPGYDTIWGSLIDLRELSRDEVDYLIALSSGYDEGPELTATSKRSVAAYPVRYRAALSAFDKDIPDEVFEKMLNEMGLFHNPAYRYKTGDLFVCYQRKGSDADMSAKVFPKSRKVQLFTTSIPGYPTWSDRDPDRPGEWMLSPSRILYFQNDQDWDEVAKVAAIISDSVGISIPAVEPMSSPSEVSGSIPDFPLAAFPDHLSDAIIRVAEDRNLPEQYLGTTCLWAISSLAGNSYRHESRPVSNIIYALLVGPVSIGKTPNTKVVMFDPLAEKFSDDDRAFEFAKRSFQEQKEDRAKERKAHVGEPPKRFVPIITDSTTEAYAQYNLDQPNGIGVYLDEAEALFNAGSYKANNDSISFMNRAFNGGRNIVARADRSKERVIPNTSISFLMGTQPERLSNIFTRDVIESGFAARFLVAYSDRRLLNEDADIYARKESMSREWSETLMVLYDRGKAYNESGTVTTIRITDSAKQKHNQVHIKNLQDSNKEIASKAPGAVLGLRAKMSTYLERFMCLLAIMHDPFHPVISYEIVVKSEMLYEYYLASGKAVVDGLMSEQESGLPKELMEIYDALPDDEFSTTQGVDILTELGHPPEKFKNVMKTDRFKKLFRKLKRGIYIKA